MRIYTVRVTTHAPSNNAALNVYQPLPAENEDAAIALVKTEAYPFGIKSAECVSMQDGKNKAGKR